MNTKRWIHLAGGLLTIVSLAFIGRLLWDHINGARGWYVSNALVLATGMGSLIYSLACLLLVAAWNHLILLFGGNPLPFRVALSLYARTQIAKYIPGNILHMAGRHALGRCIGLPHITLVFSALGEVTGLAAAASLLGLFAANAAIAGIVSWWNIAFSGMVLIIVIFLPGIWSFFRGRYPQLPALNSLEIRRELVLVLTCYLIFFFLTGSILVFMIIVEYGINELRDAFTLYLGFSLAWLVGFLVPGAPSGIGVREAIIIYYLEQLGYGSNSVLIALLFRLTTVIGDVVFLVAAGRDKISGFSI